MEDAMHPSIRRLVILSLLAALLLQPAAIATGAAPATPTPPGLGGPHTGPRAPSAASWYDGLIQYSTITNCASIIFGDPYQEEGAGTYVGFIADPNNSQPAPNQTYYVHVVIAGLGNSCSGMRAYIDLALPSSTSLAINGTNKVYCFYDGSPLTPSSDCPQTLPASSYNPGAFQIPSTDSAHADTWPIPQGHTLEIQVPVVSSAALNNSPLQANVWMLDGNDDPWLRPTEGVYVFNSGASTPSIVYPSPSTISATTTTAHSEAYLYTHNLTGTGYFDLGTDTSYSLIHDPLTITVASTAWLVYDDWGPPPLLPNTLYHWRFRFHDSNGHDTIGADQTFTTLPDGQVTLGTGTPGTCTTPAFQNAVSTAKTIKFDCGALPITLTVPSQSINANLSIDGGNKVILDAGGAGPHFTVQAGAALTLTNLTLVNGSNASCGGSIEVVGGGRLTLNGAHFFNNHSSVQAGAVCVEPSATATISGSLFLHNRAANFGGAIGNYGTLAVSGSRFVSNTAPINGGGIDATGLTSVATSTFLSNSVGFRGGGINNYLGLLTVSQSSFISNTAGLYGGGLANDSSGTWVTATTLFDNYANVYGAAIESAGTLTLTNSTVSANRARLYGGGLAWAPGADLTLLNDTVVSNTAGTHGGNFYVGGVPTATVRLKNTLVAFGSPNNCDGVLISQGHNLESANSCGLAASGDLPNKDPKIGPLQDNGGPTWTHALKFGSPALDAGTNAGCPATDQRGIARPQIGHGSGPAICDIGAYEATPGSTLLAIFLPLVRR
jgi:hypothetical protein